MEFEFGVIGSGSVGTIGTGTTGVDMFVERTTFHTNLRSSFKSGWVRFQVQMGRVRDDAYRESGATTTMEIYGPLDCIHFVIKLERVIG